MTTESTADFVSTTVLTIKGRAYSGIRFKLSQALLALDIAEVSRSLATADFSQLYRSLPEGSTVQLAIHLKNGQTRIGYEVITSATVADQLVSCISYFKGGMVVAGDSSEVKLEFWREFKSTAKTNLPKAAEILSIKTSEEIEVEARGAKKELGTAQVKLQTVEKDIQAAADIQGHMLLSNEELKAMSPLLDCHAYIVPCKDIGGDFYDCIPMGDSCFVLAIGDVSGKGVPAALMMATCATLIRAYSESSLSPAEIICKVNKKLLPGNEVDCMFTTLALVVVDCNEGRLVYCNAGHDPGVLRRADGSVVSLDVIHGPALGIFDDQAYSEERLNFDPGDQLLLYTDGISEAFSKDGETYGHHRILDYCRRSSAKVGSRLFLGGLLLDVNLFSAGEHAHDDSTMLAVRRLEKPASLQLQASASHGACAALKGRVEACCREWRIPAAAVSRLLLVLDELLGNIVMHTDAGEHAEARIEVSVRRLGQTLQLELRDSGPPFNPLEASVPDTELDLEDRSIGGLGLLLVRSITTSFSYAYSAPWNCVALEVSCQPEEQRPCLD